MTNFSHSWIWEVLLFSSFCRSCLRFIGCFTAFSVSALLLDIFRRASWCFSKYFFAFINNRGLSSILYFSVREVSLLYRSSIYLSSIYEVFLFARLHEETMEVLFFKGLKNSNELIKSFFPFLSRIFFLKDYRPFSFALWLKCVFFLDSIICLS